MGQKWLAFLTHKLGGSWGAWEGLERYLRGSRRHLEGFGRASEESKRGKAFLTHKLGDLGGLGRVWKGI